MPRLIVVLTVVIAHAAAATLPEKMLVCNADGNVVYEVANGTLFRSDDGGATFTRRSAVYSVIAVDPNDPDLLYDSAQGIVRRSEDGGRNWTSIGAPLPSFTPTPRNLVVTQSGAVFLASTCYHDHTGGGIFRTDDRGFSWSTSLVGTGQCVADIGVDPLSNAFYWINEFDPIYDTSIHPRHQVVASERRSALRYGIGYIVSNLQVSGSVAVISDDSGKSWRRLTVPGAPYQLALDGHRGRLFLVTSTGLFMSGDHGRTWRPVPNAPGEPGNVAIGGEFLYLITSHGSYRAPLATLYPFTPLGALP